MVAVFLAIALAIVVAYAGFVSIFHRIDPGQAGVVLDYAAGTAANEPVVRSVNTAQWFTLNPFTQRLVSYSIGQQTLSMLRRAKEGKVEADDSVECRLKGGIRIHIDTTTQWRPDPSRVADLYILRPGVSLAGGGGEDIEDLVVRREVRNAVGTYACSQYSLEDVFGTQSETVAVIGVDGRPAVPVAAKRLEFQERASDYLKAALSREYIIVDTFQLGELYPDSSQLDSLNRIAIAQQNAQAAQALESQRQAEARAAIAQADGEKQSAIKRAQGEAESIRVIQEELSKSPQYVQYLYATKWDGKYPTTLVEGQVTG